MASALPRAVLPSLAHAPASQWAHVYEPQEDTWLLCDALLRDRTLLTAVPRALAAEVGPGSGVVSAFLLQLLSSAPTHQLVQPPRLTVGGGSSPPAPPPAPPPPTTLLLMVDVNPAAVSAALATCASTCPGASVEGVVGDLLSPLRLPPGSLDVLLFNPPYVPTTDEEQAAAGGGAAAAWAGGADGLRVTARLLARLPALLAPGGLAYVVLVEENDPVAVVDGLRQAGLEADVVARVVAHNERLCVVRATLRAGQPGA